MSSELLGIHPSFKPVAKLAVGWMHISDEFPATTVRENQHNNNTESAIISACRTLEEIEILKQFGVAVVGTSAFVAQDTDYSQVVLVCDRLEGVNTEQKILSGDIETANNYVRLLQPLGEYFLEAAIAGRDTLTDIVGPHQFTSVGRNIIMHDIEPIQPHPTPSSESEKQSDLMYTYSFALMHASSIAEDMIRMPDIALLDEQAVNAAIDCALAIMHFVETPLLKAGFHAGKELAVIQAVSNNRDNPEALRNTPNSFDW